MRPPPNESSTLSTVGLVVLCPGSFCGARQMRGFDLTNFPESSAHRGVPVDACAEVVRQ
jgi:hypothetical protein